MTTGQDIIAKTENDISERNRLRKTTTPEGVPISISISQIQGEAASIALLMRNGTVWTKTSGKNDWYLEYAP